MKLQIQISVSASSDRQEHGRRLSEKASGNEEKHNIFVSIVVIIPVCHTEDRCSIPRQREILEINTRTHQITDPNFGVRTFRQTKTWPKTERETQRN